jgi:hypothetical protein
LSHFDKATEFRDGLASSVIDHATMGEALAGAEWLTPAARTQEITGKKGLVYGVK